MSAYEVAPNALGNAFTFLHHSLTSAHEYIVVRTSASFVRLSGTDAAALKASAQLTFGSCVIGAGAGAGGGSDVDSTAGCGGGGGGEAHPATADPVANSVNIVTAIVVFSIRYST